METLLGEELLGAILSMLPVADLCQSSRVSTRWRAAVSCEMSLRDAKTMQAGASIWKAAMYTLSAEDAHREAMDKIARRATKQAISEMDVLPNLAIVLSCNSFNFSGSGELAQCVSSLLPLHTLVLSLECGGVMGPIFGERVYELCGVEKRNTPAPGTLCEVESGNAVVVQLASLPSTMLSWILLRPGRRNRPRYCFGCPPRAPAHVGAGRLPFEQCEGSRDQVETALLQWSDPASGSLVFTSLTDIWGNTQLRSFVHAHKLLAGGVAQSVSLACRGSVNGPLPAAAVVLQFAGGNGMSVCSIPEETGHGAARVGGALRMFLNRADVDKEVTGEPTVYCPAHSTAPNAALPAFSGGFVVTCNGRGADFHCELDAESTAVRTVLPGVAVAGFFSAGEYGPACLAVGDAKDGHSGHADMLGYTCVTALFS
uniref:F-box domain-containing protein n=1 Tax=Chrysotila carterae TaxID=13221 RepID=A0A7S4C033_CHRCT|mmetsp:Transcript_26148/g.54931  ORF Transcript_26148/g.54931 Transcript_26148/m.54931 type:complete len:428 (-) Transcript_26148:519-1802(-)